MKTETTYCEVCKLCIVNNDGIIVRNADIYEKDEAKLAICNSCITAGNQSFLELWGYKKNGSVASRPYYL